MANKIISKNQKGGITAGTVNIGSQINEKQPTEKKIPRWLVIVGILFGIVGAVFTIFSFFG